MAGAAPEVARPREWSWYRHRYTYKHPHLYSQGQDFFAFSIRLRAHTHTENPVHNDNLHITIIEVQTKCIVMDRFFSNTSYRVPIVET